MYRKQSSSLSNLQNSISRQIMQFQNIQLTHSRHVLPISCKNNASSGKSGQRIFNKSVSKSAKTLKMEPTTKRSTIPLSTKVQKPDQPNLKNHQLIKTSSKLKKKGFIVPRPAIKQEQKSLASTKCVQRKELTCDDCQHSKLNFTYLSIIQQQRRLIANLQGIISRMDQ